MSLDSSPNPYQPPQSESPRIAFHRRLRHAFSKAYAEYRNGLKREQFTTLGIIKAWLELLFASVMALFVVIILSATLLGVLGFFD